MNQFNGIGHLTRDPQITYIPEKQTCVAKFTIAINRMPDKNGERKADYINCVSFGKTAEYLDKYVHKGNKVAVTGSIKTGSYEDRSGKTVYTTDVQADRVENLTPRDMTPAEDDFVKPEPKQENWDVGGFSKLDKDDIPF